MKTKKRHRDPGLTHYTEVRKDPAGLIGTRTPSFCLGVAQGAAFVGLQGLQPGCELHRLLTAIARLDVGPAHISGVINEPANTEGSDCAVLMIQERECVPDEFRIRIPRKRKPLKKSANSLSPMPASTSSR